MAYGQGMIGQYKVNRPTRRCAASNRPLEPGEWYYSVISGDEESLVRLDYAAKDWTGPPEESIGYWKRRMPEAGPRKLVLAPAPVLIDLLRQMEAFPDRAQTRFVLALLLMRKRLIEPVQSTDQAMTVRVIADGSEMTVANCNIEARVADSLAASLQALLYTDEAETDQSELEDAQAQDAQAQDAQVGDDDRDHDAAAMS